MADRVPRYNVLPLPVVQKWAAKNLSVVQLREGIKLAKRLKYYPNVPDLKIERCGDVRRVIASDRPVAALSERPTSENSRWQTESDGAGTEGR